MVSSIKNSCLFFACISFLFSACWNFNEETTLHQSQKSIIGGKTDSTNPAVGALVPRQAYPFCTAALIGPKLVLTAAHCIDQLKQIEQQHKAIVDFRLELPQGSSYTSKTYEIKTTQKHPNYNGNTRDGYDLAVITLKTSVEETSPITTYLNSINSSWVAKQILHQGYGLIQTLPQDKYVNRKYSALIPISKVNNDSFQTYKKGVSTCSGDSGGPALYKHQNQYTVLGVTSYGINNTPNTSKDVCDGYTVISRLDFYKNWLSPIINSHLSCSQDSDCGSCYTCTNNKCAHKCKLGSICKITGSTTTCDGKPTNTTPTCGDGKCNGKENCQTCSKDCRCRAGQVCNADALCKPTAVCGDGFCDQTQNETCQSCSKDCQCPQPTPDCGDGTCDTLKGENCRTCSKDCGCKSDQICQQNQCQQAPTEPNQTDESQDEPTSPTKEGSDAATNEAPNKKPPSNQPQCSEDEQSLKCDEQGENCKIVCVSDEPTETGCSSHPKQQSSWFCLLVCLLLSFRRSTRKTHT